MVRMILVVSIFVLGFASDARFGGMGGLSFILEDDLHNLNLCDFAGISAGLLNSDSLPSVMVRASGLNEIWQKDSLTYLAIGQAIPQKLIDYAPVEAVSFYEAIPQFPIVPCEFIYTSLQLKEAYDDWGNLKPPQSWRIYGSYSQLSRGYLGDTLADRVKTPAFSGIFSKPISKNWNYGIGGDVFYGMYNSADNKDKGKLFPIGAGAGFFYHNPLLNLGLNLEYHYPMFEFQEIYGTVAHTREFKGHSASPVLGMHIKLSKITWLTALDYKWASLAGEYDTFDIGDLKITGYGGRTKAHFAFDFLKFALFGEYNNRTPAYIRDTTKWFESTFKNYILGIGIGKTIKNLTIGMEGLYKYRLLNDKLEDTSLVGNDYVIKIGAEYGFIKNLFVRSGYNYNQVDPNLDKSDDNTIFNVITCGLGINLKNLRLDTAYNYKLGKPKSDPEEKITDHILFLYLRYNLKSE